MGEDAAAKVGAELLLDEAGSRLLPASRTCEKGLQVLANDLVKKSSFGLVTLVLDGVVPSRDRVLHWDRSKFGACSRLVFGCRRSLSNESG